MTGRVLQVIPSVSPVHGGPSAAMRTIETALSLTRWRSETATTDDDGRGKRMSRVPGTLLVDEDAPRWYFPKDTEFYKLSWSFLRWIFREVRQYDVVHIHALFSFTSLAAGFAARRAGVPYVIRPLGVLNDYGMRSRRPWLKRWSVRMLEGPLLRDAAAVHFTSELEREQALSLGIPLRPILIPLAVPARTTGDPQRVRNRLPQAASGPFVLYLSRLDPVKNCESLLRAVALLQRDGLRLSLLMAGSGNPEYERQLRDLGEREGLGAHVHWLGHVGGELKADLLSCADLFVLPSFSENFGIAVVEALAAGLPCVLTKGVGLAAAVEAAGAGVIVDADPLSIADGLRRLLTSPEQHRTASAAARLMIEQEYSLEVLGRRLASLYDTVLAEHASTARTAESSNAA